MANRTELIERLKSAAGPIVDILLQEEHESMGPLLEASVHRPKRSQIWAAAFTGPTGGQVWKSTGLTDRNQALLVARKWEAEARAQRHSIGATTRKQVLRARRSPSAAGNFMLTQREVALLLNLSERTVREIECRAFRKIRNHPLLRQAWQQYLAAELDEHQPTLAQAETDALFNLVRTPEERHLIQKILRLIQGP